MTTSTTTNALDSSIVDSNGDGFVDGGGDYRLFRDGSAISLSDSRGRSYSDSTTNYWNATKSIADDDGFHVLIEGMGLYGGRYRIWDVGLDGVIKDQKGWYKAEQMVGEGYEVLFNHDFNNDKHIGPPPIVDNDNDGFVDGGGDYRLFRAGSTPDSATALTLKAKSGRSYSDGSTDAWNATKAVLDGSGFAVLVEGAARMAGRFQVWDINSDGVITTQNGWYSPEQMMTEGYELTFDRDFNGDGHKGAPPVVDADGDGFDDSSSDYRLFRTVSATESTPNPPPISVLLTNNSGRTFSNASSNLWDATKSIIDGNGFAVLVKGVGRLAGRYQVWDVGSDGVITRENGWYDADQMMEQGYETSFNNDFNEDGHIGEPPVVDSDGDGFIDGVKHYQLFRAATDSSSLPTAVALKDDLGRVYSNASSNDWDATKAIIDGTGFAVLVEGSGRIAGRYKVWDVGADGVITKENGWFGADQMVEQGYESSFNRDFNGDGHTGTPPIVDSNADGFVDGGGDYRLFRNSSDPNAPFAVLLKAKSGRPFSDASTDNWDATKAITNGTGFAVLVEGSGRMAGRFQVWDVGLDGVVSQTNGWFTAEEMMTKGYETIFDRDFNADNHKGSPPVVDSDGDGFVDGSSHYRLYRTVSATESNPNPPATSVLLTNNSGRTFSNASSNLWDATKSIIDGNGFTVLLEGRGRVAGRYKVWDVGSDGVITNENGWLNANQMMEQGYELSFDHDFNNDGHKGAPPVVDAGGDGFVDGDGNYRLFRSATSPDSSPTAISLKSKRGDYLSKSSSKFWDATKAIDNGSGFAVLIDGTDRKDGTFKVWNVGSDGVILSENGWYSADQMMEQGYEKLFDRDFNNDGHKGAPPIVDSDSNGLADGSGDYRLVRTSSGSDSPVALTLKSKSGRGFSNASSSVWDATKSIQNANGFTVLVEGNGRLSGRYKVWDVGADGEVTKQNGWYSSDQMMEQGYETFFDRDFNSDGRKGVPPVEDSNGDGFADGSDNYQLVRTISISGTDSLVASALKSKSGRELSDASSDVWDATKSIRPSGNDFAVLVEGNGRMTGRYKVWDVGVDGEIKKHNGWYSADQMMEQGYETLFARDFNNDGHTGTPPVIDSDSDGFADGQGDYRLFRPAATSESSPTAVILKDKMGRSFDDDSSNLWNAKKSVREGSDFVVLLEGSGKLSGRFRLWDVGADGVITSKNRWTTADKMIQYETLFDRDFNGDNHKGALDNDGDGLVDGSGHYLLFNNDSLVVLKNKRGRDYSDASSKVWDATKVITEKRTDGNIVGYKVLLEGNDRYAGRYKVWDVGADGVITKENGWYKSGKMLSQGYETIFNRDFNEDNTIGVLETPQETISA